MTVEGTCCVCAEPVDETTSTFCNNCQQQFHLRQREDTEGKDCGEVWINDQYMSLEYACHTCLGTGPRSGATEPPIGMGH